MLNIYLYNIVNDDDYDGDGGYGDGDDDGDWPCFTGHSSFYI